MEVQHNAARSRFEISLGERHALLAYKLHPSSMALIHTEVPPEFEGQGIGSQLAHAALEYARAAGLKVDPRCPFVAAYIARHPEYADLL